MSSAPDKGKYRISIKIAATRRDASLWGDYHMAYALQRELEARGYPCIVQIHEDWENGADADCDAVIALRGLKPYQPKPQHINLLWHISHPRIVGIAEYNRYDYVLIASEKWAKMVESQVKKPVEVMHQCTDENLFRPSRDHCHGHELLFVGNGRRDSPRKIVHNLIPTERDLGVYGRFWEGLIDGRYIKGSYIDNDNLSSYYASCGILLNDHWRDMRECGFINNRIFDGLASEAFIITDPVEGIHSLFEDSVITYNPHSRKGLRKLVQFYLSRPDLRVEKAKRGAEIVRRSHTFAHRAERFAQIIDELKQMRSGG